MSEHGSFNLILQWYCDGCGDFEADVQKTDISSLEEETRCMTDIHCKNAGKCRRMKERLNH